MTTKALAIDLISIDGGTQFRASTNDAKVKEYADMLLESKEWPFDSVCIVFHDGVDYFLVDGFHRYLGAKLANRASIQCDVRQGSNREAIHFALSANSRHGLHRTNEDKRKAVAFAISDDEWGKLSSRAIAELCGVSSTFIDSERKSVANDGQLKPETRSGKDGKKYQPTKPSKPSKPKPKPKKPEQTYEDAEPDEETVSEPAKETVANGSPQALLAHINAIGTQLDKLKRDVVKLSDETGGEWLEMATIPKCFDDLKFLIKSGGYWVDCPDCAGKGCKTCKMHGWLSLDRKGFLTQQQKDKLGSA